MGEHQLLPRLMAGEWDWSSIRQGATTFNPLRYGPVPHDQ